MMQMRDLLATAKFLVAYVTADERRLVTLAGYSDNTAL